jgi:hypothetical protein
MAKIALVIGVLTIATAVGTALTVGFYSAGWGWPDSILWPCVLVAAGHLLLCGAYAIMGESAIEDAVKSGLFAICGGVMLYRHPLLGLFAISAAIWALVVNQLLQRGCSR